MFPFTLTADKLVSPANEENRNRSAFERYLIIPCRCRFKLSFGFWHVTADHITSPPLTSTGHICTTS